MHLLSQSDFLHKVLPTSLLRNELIELRAIDRADSSIKRSFHFSIRDFEKAARGHSGRDIYFGVSTRRGDHGKKDGCFRSQVVWVDFDNAKFKEVDPPPNIAVGSGGGWHFYWFLKTPAVLNDAERVADLEAINRGLANRFDGDIAAIDASRILRVAGYRNHKYDPPREVRAYSTGIETLYSLDYFRKNGIYLPKPPTNAEEIVLTAGAVIPPSDLPKRARLLLQNPGGPSHDGDFSSQDSAAITSMLAAGFKPKDVYATFVHSPRGKHAAERKTGHFEDYVQRTISKASGHIKNNSEVSLDFSKNHDTKANRTSKGGVIEERLELIEPQRTEWLWPPYIPAGRITVLAGDPGIGKSQLAIDLVSRISRGAAMPESEAAHGTVGNCAIATAEDHTAETIVPRIIAANGNRSKIRVIRKVSIDEEQRYLSLPRDLEAIKTYIVDQGLRLLIIDPLNAFIGAGTDTYKDHDIRLVLGPLEDVAETTGCAILVIAHLTKKEDVSTLYRVGGSIGFIGAARSVLAVSKDKNDDDRKILYSLKCNLSKRPPALQYSVEQVSSTDSTHIKWHGLSEFDPEKTGKEEGPQKLKECRDFLMQELSEGKVLATKIISDACLVGLAKRTLDKYKLQLGVRSNREGDEWYWYPPKKGWNL